MRQHKWILILACLLAGSIIGYPKVKSFWDELNAALEELDAD
jgi:hypothetical protein